MALHARADEVQNTTPGITKYMSATEQMLTKKVYGNEMSLMVASRPAGYHSFPHSHDAEQLNYCLEGEIWIFVGEEASLLRAGDFSRVPRGAIHWAWNRSDQPVTLLESHTPPLISFPENPEREKQFVGLFGAEEPAEVDNPAANIFRDEYGDFQKAVEERFLAAEPVPATA